MSKQDTIRYRDLISRARQAELNASLTTGAVRERWAARAQELRIEAEDLPDDFVDPPFVMPAWGTYGT